MNFAGTNNTTANNNYTAFSSGFQIYFNSGAGAFTLTGNAINFYNFGSNAPTIENDSTNLQTVQFQVDVENGNSMNIIANSGNLLFNNAGIYLDGNSSMNFTANAGKTITVAETINNSTNGVTIGNSIGSSTGGGTVIFAGANTYVGNTTINGGTLQLGNGGTTGSVASGNTIFFNVGSNTSPSSGTLAINRSDSPTISNNLTMNSSSDWANVSVAQGTTATLSGAITGAGEFWATGSGNLVIADNASSASRTNSNVVSSGTLSISDFTSSTLGTGGFFVTTGTLNYTGTSTSTTRIGNFALQSANSAIGVSSATTTLTLTNDIGGFSGGGLVKTGAGTLALTPSESYTAATSVQAGTLEVDGSLNSASAVTIGGNGSSSTPTLRGTGTVNGSVTVAAAGTGVAGTISPGTAGTPTGTLTVGSISFQNGSTLAIALNSTTASKLVSSGAATFAGTDNITFSGTTGATTTTGVGDYKLATATSGLTSSAFTGTAPTDYRVIGSGTSLDLVHQATIGTITSTPASASIITGGSTTFGITVQNSAPTSSSNLSAGAASGSNTTGSIAANTITTAAQTTGSTYSGLSFNGTTVGASQNGTFTVSDANADNSPQTGTVTVNVYGHASGSLSGSTLNIGNVHVGYTAPVTSSNSVTASNASGFLVNLAGSGTNGNESLTSVSGVAAGGTSSAITATLATGQGVGNLNSVVYTFGDSSALSGASNNVGTATVTVSGQVYSGTSTWTTNGGGTWGTTSSNFGTNWGTNQGSPGLDSNFKTTDSATFAGAATSGTATVTLGSASPYLSAATFNDSAASYDIEQGAGGTGTLHLDSTTTATVTVSAGSHVIGAPVELDSATATSVASSSTLTVNGVISQSGTQTLTINGAGTTVLTGANTFSGGMAVNAGTLQLGNGSGSATGTGSLTVGAGATIAGYGSSSGTSFSVSGTGTATGSRANVQVGMNSASDTNTTHTLSLIGSATSTITNANLMFNISASTKGALGSDPSGSGTELNVGATKVSFGAGLAATTLTLNVENEPAIISAYTPYVLIAGSLVTGGGGVNGSQYTGLTLGTTLINSGGITETIITGNNLQLAFGTALDQTYYGGKSYLVLYQDAANNIDDIDVVVVPEPGTWALMIGGLATLIFWQRSKRNRKD